MRKSISLILVFAIILSMFTLDACNKSEENNEFIPCDWYQSSTYEIDIPFEGYRDSYFYADIMPDHLNIISLRVLGTLPNKFSTC